MRVLTPMAWLWLCGCSADVVDMPSSDADWAVSASEVSASLVIGCADAAAGGGPFEVVVDDRSGWTLIAEQGTGRVWLRDPFGVVPDRCWWLPDGGNASLDLPCFLEDGQDGSCPEAEDIVGWAWRAPGVAVAHAPVEDLVMADGIGLARIGTAVHRLDMTPSDHEAVDASENRRTFASWLDAMVGPGLTALAASDAHIVGYEPGTLWVWDKERAPHTLSGGTELAAPRDASWLAAAGDHAVLGSDRLDVYELESGRHQRIRHPQLGELLDVAVTPDGTAWALVDGAVLSFGAEVRRYPTPGAQHLVTARPADVPVVYAWGNDNSGVVYKLGDEASAWRLDQVLLGLGVGVDLQEIVTVLAGPDGPVVSSWLDGAHLGAVPEGTVGLALAVFAESPRDAELAQPAAAAAQIGLTTCGEPPEGEEGVFAVCCVHGARGSLLAKQLGWLGERIDRSAVIVGVNPTAIAQSRLCDGLGDTYSVWGGSIPRALDDFLHSHDEAAAAVLLHSSPYKASSGYVGCPDSWEPAADCWDVVIDEDSYRGFYEDLVGLTALTPYVGREPDWALLGGGFDGSHVNGAPDWTEVFADVPLPDGDVADGLFFGSLAMAPATSQLAGKELAPDNASARAFPVPIGSPASGWDRATPGDATYWPGQTFALPWLYELRRSGLLFRDFDQVVAQQASWEADFRGPEDIDVMTHADFALAEHWLVTRVLAHRDVTRSRWTYIHLGDLTRLRAKGVHDGWIDCDGDCATDTELDRFLDRVDGWSPAVHWQARP